MCSGGGTGTSTSPPGERVVQPDHGLYNTLTTPFHAPDNPPIDLSYLSPLSPAPRDVFDTVIGKWRATDAVGGTMPMDCLWGKAVAL